MPPQGKQGQRLVVGRALVVRQQGQSLVELRECVHILARQAQQFAVVVSKNGLRWSDGHGTCKKPQRLLRVPRFMGYQPEHMKRSPLSGICGEDLRQSPGGLWQLTGVLQKPGTLKERVDIRLKRAPGR